MQRGKKRVAGKKVAEGLRCNACYRNGGACVQKDDMAEIREKMLEADVIALASPIYFYSMTARMKAVIDRTFAFYSQLDGFTCCTPNAKEGGVVPGRNGSRRHSRVESHGRGLRAGEIFFHKNQCARATSKVVAEAPTRRDFLPFYAKIGCCNFYTDGL